MQIPQLDILKMDEKSISVARKALDAHFDHPPMAFVQSFGCQQSMADGEKLSGVLEQLGFGFTQQEQGADLVLFNTCAVRETAEDRVYGHIGALKTLKQQNPKMILIVCGCMAQRDEVQQKLKISYPYVDVVFGTGAVHHLPQLITQRLQSKKRVFFNQMAELVVEDIPVVRDPSVRSWLPIMQGCDNYCAYCIVPYVRGREVSRPMERVQQDAKALLQSGCKEITLLGQNVNSYGKGNQDHADFPALVRQLDKLEGEHWIRFMTSHPKDCTPQLIDALAQSKHFCRHIHLPVQSGSNRILQLMNRRYTVEHYLDLIAYAQKVIPGVTFSSDIIIGFPGEEWADFEATFDLIKKMRYNALFTFIYSKRSGTVAASMPDDTAAEEKSRRFSMLLQTQQQICGELNQALVGTTQTVLMDGLSKKEGLLTGRTQGNIIVEAALPPHYIGHFVPMKITKAMNAAICGEIEL